MADRRLRGSGGEPKCGKRKHRGAGPPMPERNHKANRAPPLPTKPMLAKWAEWERNYVHGVHRCEAGSGNAGAGKNPTPYKALASSAAKALFGSLSRSRFAPPRARRPLLAPAPIPTPAAPRDSRETGADVPLTGCPLPLDG
jgi:hypothetical protein